MGKLVKALLAVIVIGGGVVVAVVVAGVVVGGLWYRSVPKVEVINQCTNPIVIPEQFRVISVIPESIATDARITVPVVSGSGQYSLYEEGDSVYLQLPREVPALGDQIRVGGAGKEPDAAFDGAPVTIPMQRELTDTRYELTLCP